MSNNPELIIFSQYLLGGGASFHRNMLANMPETAFELKVIYHYPKNGIFTPSLEFHSRPNDVIFDYNDESLLSIIKRLSTHISNHEGLVVTNLDIELYCLDLYPKNNKVIYFICHDDGFLHLAKKFRHIISVFIAHNIEVFESLKKLLPHRLDNIFFIPHGVQVQHFIKPENYRNKLKIAYLARHHILKGIYDLPLINQILLKHNVEVDWLIMGDGNEREKFLNQTKNILNFVCYIAKNNEDVIKNLKECDVFILPSRKDGLPVALLEAMSVGCVPIVSNFSEGIKQVVTDDLGYVVKVADNVAFANCILDLNKNRNELKIKSLNCIKSIEENYNIKKNAKKYFDLYSKFELYKNTAKNRRIYRLINKTYFFLISKIYYPYLIAFKRKLIDIIQSVRSR
jgi:glycosyltransferase involved in cell wall biosynthesis